MMGGERVYRRMEGNARSFEGQERGCWVLGSCGMLTFDNIICRLFNKDKWLGVYDNKDVDISMPADTSCQERQ